MNGTARFFTAAGAAFVAMEGVSYATHRWVMHGPGLAWHESHHAPPTGRWEKNDRFPLLFSSVGVGLFAGAAAGLERLWPIATGVTAYGIAYGAVHELFIHRRLPCPQPTGRYVAWMRRSHAEHHREGGEPYGMLLPLLRRRSSADDGPAPVDVDRRASVRTMRARL